jgi:LmbE family N-acetylglucosaminyl deacetylase
MAKTTLQPLHPSVVLGVAAHPDDLDFAAGGTFAKFAKSGAAVYYLILTDGGKGTHDRNLPTTDLIRTRQNEQRVAAEALGATDVRFLAYPDGELENTKELKKDICKVIRELKPDVVITIDPSMLYSANRGFINHPDHRAAGQATLDAVFPLARDYLSFPELDEQGFAPHEVATVLLSNFDSNEYCVDITDTIEQKMAAIAAHESQLSGIATTQAELRKRAHELGEHLGYEYAECFVRIDVRP